MFPVTINLFLSCYVVYTARTRSCIHSRAVYRAVYRRPVTYTAVYTARKARPCLRHVHSSVHIRPCRWTSRPTRPCMGSVTAMKQVDTR